MNPKGKELETELVVVGGIKIDEPMEVFDKEEKLMPGLYAAGVEKGGWVSETYVIKLSGYEFGVAVDSGRIAGENAAAFALENRGDS